jgi:hypothetical protein
MQEDECSVSSSVLAGRLKHADLSPSELKCVVVLVFAEERDELVLLVRCAASSEDVVEAANQECV